MDNKKILNLYYEVKNSIVEAMNNSFAQSYNNKEENSFAQSIKLELKKLNTQYISEIENLEKTTEWDKLCISFFGETNAGKSTIIETLRIIYNEDKRLKRIHKKRRMLFALKLFHWWPSMESKITNYIYATDGEIIGTGRRDYTRSVTGYTLHRQNKDFVLYDVPGIEDNEKKYESIIQKAVNKAHLVFFITGDTKEIEPATAEKIKKYLRNDTDVFSIINLHLPPKKQRDVEIDGTYQDELKRKFRKIENSVIKTNTEKTLIEKLGNNYKGGIILNGKQAFCACAFKDGMTTIIPNTGDKKLREDQSKFMNEYSSDVDAMKQDSRIDDIVNIIDNHSVNFESFIIESNKKKFVARLKETYDKVSVLTSDAKKKCEEFVEGYQDIKNAAIRAQSDFSNYITGSYIEESVQDVMGDVLQEMYKLIEKKEGKLEQSDCDKFFNERQKRIENNIQNDLQNNFKEAASRFENHVNEAVRRFGNDIANMRKIGNVQFSIPKPDMSGIADAMKYGLKDFFKKDLWSIGGLALGGAALGSAFPVIGNIIGAIGGALIGIIMSIITWVAGNDRRIAKAKNIARDKFNDAEYQIVGELKKNFPSSICINKMADCSETIQRNCDDEIHKFRLLETNMEILVDIVDTKITKLNSTRYGEL